MTDHAHDVGPLFAALADPTRRRIVHLLGTSPHRAGELAAATGTSAPAMSRHLRVLLGAGLVADERGRDDAQGTAVRLRPQSVVALRAWVDQLQAEWDHQLAAFKDHIERHAEEAARTAPRPAQSPRPVTETPAHDLGGRGGRRPGHRVPGLHRRARPVVAPRADQLPPASRIVAKQCEPGVGGRILEVYTDGELELARITTWASVSASPGPAPSTTSASRWPSPRPRPAPALSSPPAVGRRRRPGRDVLAPRHPHWFGDWCARRDNAPPELRELDQLLIAVHSMSPPPPPLAAGRPRAPPGPGPVPESEDDLHWMEFGSGTAPSWSSPSAATCGGGTPDPRAVDIRRRPPTPTTRGPSPPGRRSVEPVHETATEGYTVADPEGHHWMIAQAWPGMQG